MLSKTIVAVIVGFAVRKGDNFVSNLQGELARFFHDFFYEINWQCMHDDPKV